KSPMAQRGIKMKRQEFITLPGTATALSLNACGQQSACRVGMLLAAYTETDAAPRRASRPFCQGSSRRASRSLEHPKSLIRVLACSQSPGPFRQPGHGGLMTNTSSEMIGGVNLELGGFISAVEVAYITYGKLSPQRNNAILLTHGYTTTHLFCEGGAAASESSWHDVVGPGKPIDTERYFVISSNMLGSSYGTTAPRSIDPTTGKPYGPHFPPITLNDIVTVQRRLLEKLGINRLLAVVGPYGGMQAFSWATEFPDFMKGTVAVVTSLGPPPRSILERITAMLRADPNWN